jgi:hypothetical protein
LFWRSRVHQAESGARGVHLPVLVQSWEIKTSDGIPIIFASVFDAKMTVDFFYRLPHEACVEVTLAVNEALANIIPQAYRNRYDQEIEFESKSKRLATKFVHGEAIGARRSRCWLATIHPESAEKDRAFRLESDVELATISPGLKVVDSLSSTVPEAKLAGDTERKELATAPAPERALRVGRLFTCTTPECQ